MGPLSHFLQFLCSLYPVTPLSEDEWMVFQPSFKFYLLFLFWIFLYRKTKKNEALDQYEHMF